MNIDMGRRVLYTLACLALAARLEAAPSQLWQVTVGGYADKPAVADLNGDGRLEVVLATDSGQVICLSGGNGAGLWEFDSEGDRFLCCPLVADVDGDQAAEILVTGSRNGSVWCLNGEDGTVVWKQPGGLDGIAGTPALGRLSTDGPLVLAYVLGNSLVVREAATGSVVWSKPLPDKSDGAPTIADIDGGPAEILVGTNNGQLLAYAADGQVKWAAEVRGRVTKPAVVVDADKDFKLEIYLSGDGGLSRIEPNGKVRWQFRPASGRGLSSSVAVFDVNGDGRHDLVVAGSDGGLYAVNDAGKQLWRHEIVPRNLTFIPGCTPAIADVNGDGAGDPIFVSPRSDDPKIAAVNGRTGQTLWSVAAKSFAHCCPLVADLDGDSRAEVLFCVPRSGGRGIVTALRLGAAPKIGWLKYQGDSGCSGNYAQIVVDAQAFAAGRSPFPVAARVVNWEGKLGPAPVAPPTPGGAAPPVSAGRPASAIAVQLDGRWLALDPPPASISGRTMVPLRGIFEAMQATVEWDAATKTVRAERRGTTVQLTIGQKTALVSGQPVTLDVPGQIVNGSTYVPLRFVGEAFGARVEWQAAERNVIITSAAGG